MTSFIFVLIAAVLVFGYTVLLCVSNKEIPASLSESVYNMKPSQSWLWSVVLAAACVLTVPSLWAATSENTQFLIFITLVSIAFTLVTPLIRSKSDINARMHTVACIVAILCSQAMIAVNSPLPLLLWMPYFGMQAYYTRRCGPWRTQDFWAVMVAFATTFLYAIV